MLSPTNESSNPFFAMTTGGALSDTLIFDLGMGSPMQTKQRLTPSDELNFTRNQDDFLDLDYFGLDIHTVKHHPTRLSSASLASTTSSSSTPSEADSDLIERASQDEDQLLHLDMASCSFPMTPNSGFQKHGFVPSSRSGRRESASQQQQHHHHQLNAAPSHVSIALSSFNLSDFISDHEQDQYQGQQQQQQPQSTAFVTPDRPHDMRMLALRSVSYSPASTNSPQTPDWEGGHFQPSSLRSSMKREFEFETGADSSLLAQRPWVLMRACTDSNDNLSCNPAQITPSHAHLMEQLSGDRSGYFYSLHHGQEAEHHNVFTGDEYSITSPPSLYSSPTQEYNNLWSSIEDGESKQDVFDGSSSPLFHHQEPRSVQTQEPLDVDFLTSAGRIGAMRSARLSAIEGNRRSSLPYQSPVIEQTLASNEAKLMAMPGIITKRSRGRRVPSNPDELSNLGKSGKVYTCKVPGCGKCFKRSEHLKRHVRSIHTNEKPFTCHCGKTFSRHDNLNQHARVHTMEGEEDSASESASASPSVSPTTLPVGYLQSQRGSVSQFNSRLRKATIADNVDYEEEEEGNLFDLEG